MGLLERRAFVGAGFGFGGPDLPRWAEAVFGLELARGFAERAALGFRVCLGFAEAALAEDLFLGVAIERQSIGVLGLADRQGTARSCEVEEPISSSGSRRVLASAGGGIALASWES